MINDIEVINLNSTYGKNQQNQQKFKLLYGDTETGSGEK